MAEGEGNLPYILCVQTEQNTPSSWQPPALVRTQVLRSCKKNKGHPASVTEENDCVVALITLSAMAMYCMAR
eukprot:scaffold7292_cov84-Skeletonema_dohrnii-CCMP3373.AAC.2